MRTTVLFPLRTVSENRIRAMLPWHRGSRVKDERKAVASFLQAVLPPPRATIAAGGVEVTLTRIAPGTLDAVNLGGALKAVQDQVAAFLGVDDGDPIVAWHFRQEPCARGTGLGRRSYHGVRVEIATPTPGADVVRHFGPAVPPPRNRRSAPPGADAAATSGPAPAKATAERGEHRPVIAWAVYPWDQQAGAPTWFAPVRVVAAPEPPATIRRPAPAKVVTSAAGVEVVDGGWVELRGRQEHVAGLGGDVWVYRPVEGET